MSAIPRALLLFALGFRTDAFFTGSFSGIKWQGGFEKGFIRQEYNEIVGSPPAGRQTIVQEASTSNLKPRCGKNFLHIKLDGSDVAYNHNRVEIGFHPEDKISGEKMSGTTRYYGWSMAHDSSKPISADSTYELAYWESKNVWAQTIGFYMSDGKTLKLRTRGNGDKDVGSMSFPPGAWHDFVMGIHWSNQGWGDKQGWVQLWMDGKEVVPKTKHQTLNSNLGNPSFSHLGLFRIPKVQTESWIYYDCVVYAESYEPSESKGCYNDEMTMGSCKEGGGGKGDDNDDNGGGDTRRRKSGGGSRRRKTPTSRRRSSRRRRKSSSRRRKSSRRRGSSSRRRKR